MRVRRVSRDPAGTEPTLVLRWAGSCQRMALALAVKLRLGLILRSSPTGPVSTHFDTLAPKPHGPIAPRTVLLKPWHSGMEMARKYFAQ